MKFWLTSERRLSWRTSGRTCGQVWNGNFSVINLLSSSFSLKVVNAKTLLIFFSLQGSAWSGSTKWPIYLLEVEQTTRSNYLWVYTSCAHSTFVCQSCPVNQRQIISWTLLRVLSQYLPEVFSATKICLLLLKKKLLVPGPSLRDGRGVGQHAHCPGNFGHVCTRDSCRWLVVDADLWIGKVESLVFTVKMISISCKTEQNVWLAF